MSWYVPFHKLSQEQRWIATNALDNPNHIIWVRGYAGVGKTTVLFQMAEIFRNIYSDKSIAIITYTHALVEMLQMSLEGYKDITNAKVMTYNAFVRQSLHFDYVFLDEVQDVTDWDLWQIKQKSTHLYVAGDFNQQIYGSSISETKFIDMLSPNISELREVYRLTKTVANVANHILPTANILAGSFVNTNADTTAKLIKFNDIHDEYEWLIKESNQRARAFKPSAILFSYHSNSKKPIASLENFCKFLANKYGFKLRYSGTQLDYYDFNRKMDELDLDFRFFGNGKGSLAESDTKPIIYLMLFHSAKGLDFQSVFIPCVNEEREFWRDDDKKELERRLLFVATTRTRQDLFLTYHSDKPHMFLENINSSYLIHHKELNSQDNDADNEDKEVYF